MKTTTLLTCVLLPALLWLLCMLLICIDHIAPEVWGTRLTG